MTWEGTEENYNIFRWYRAGWGRYTQVDPLANAAFARHIRTITSRDLPDFDTGEQLGYDYVGGDPVNSYDSLGLAPYRMCESTGDIPKIEFYIEDTTESKKGWRKKSRVYARICRFRCYCLDETTCFNRPCPDPVCHLRKDHGLDESITFKGTKAAQPCKRQLDAALALGKCDD